MEGYVAARVFAEAARKAGKSLTRESLLAAVQTLSDVDLGGFNLNFGPKKNTGSSFVELTLLTKDGNVRR
jgi:ABC-type branched-subunit amino acid transport system substrate-binding protein